MCPTCGALPLRDDAAPLGTAACTVHIAPAAFTAEYRRAGGDPSRLHFLITGTDAYPPGPLPAGCTTPMACQWALAESTAAGRAIRANGAGGYRLGSHARPWLAEWQARVS
jgi:hypothetical protein